MWLFERNYIKHIWNPAFMHADNESEVQNDLQCACQEGGISKKDGNKRERCEQELGARLNAIYHRHDQKYPWGLTNRPLTTKYILGA